MSVRAEGYRKFDRAGRIPKDRPSTHEAIVGGQLGRPPATRYCGLPARRALQVLRAATRLERHVRPFK